MAGPAGGPGLHRGMAGTGGGRLWSTNHAETLFSDRPQRRAAHCVAGTDPRAGGQPGGKGRNQKAVAQRSGDHRLEPAHPLHFRNKGGSPGAVRGGGGPSAGQEYHAAGGQGRGQIRDPVRLPVPGDRQPRRRVPGARAGGTAPDHHSKTWVWRGLPCHGAADHAQQPERRGHLHHRSREHDNGHRGGRPSNADHPHPGGHRTDGRRGPLPEHGGANPHPGFQGGGVRGVSGHDPVPHRANRAGTGPGRDRSHNDH